VSASGLLCGLAIQAALFLAHHVQAIARPQKKSLRRSKPRFFYCSPFLQKHDFQKIFLPPSPTPQHQIQLIHHLRPIRIVQDFLTQKCFLAGCPEKRICQFKIRLEWRMGGHKLINADRVMLQAKLFEQRRQTVHGRFHDGLLKKGI
jgi:hypothetical protein